MLQALALGVLLASSTALSASSSKWGAGSVLRAVFGFEQDAEAAGSRQRAHFDELFEAARAARASPALSADAGRVFRSSRHHVLCSDVRSKSRAESSLAGLSPSVPYHPIFTSSQRDMVCYMSIMDGVTASSLPVDVFRAVVPVEAFLRLHSSVIDLATSLSPSVGESASILSKDIFSLRKIKEASHPMHFDLHRGLGVRRLGISEHKSSREIAETVRQRLHSDAHAWALDFARINGVSDERHEGNVASSSSSAGSWLHHLRSMASFVRSSQSSGQRVSDVCGFSSIRFSDLPRGVRVHGVEGLHRPECVLLLAAHLAVSSDDGSFVTLGARPEIANDFARPLSQTGMDAFIGELGNFTVAPNGAPYSAAGLNGTGQVIGIGDTGLDELMCFFTHGDGTLVPRSSISNPYTDHTRRKVIQYISYMDAVDYPSGHGTHVSGSVCGLDIDPNSPLAANNGMAYAAKIAFFDLNNANIDGGVYTPADMYNDYFAVAATSGAHLHTNSWSSPLNYYDSMSMDTDEYLFDHPEFLVFYSAGNRGADGYGSLGSPNVAKNSMSIGATEAGHNTTKTPDSDPQNMAYFSSIGPTYDGRIKPDVCAPGLTIYSALAANRTIVGDAMTCEITAKSGTSMATPITASNAALVRQYFTDPAFWQAECSRYAPAASCAAFSPSGTLVKAILIGSGDPMNAYITRGKTTTVPYTELGAPPDYFQGYGRVQLDNILPLHSATPSDQRLYVEDQISIGESFERVYKAAVTNSSIPFRFGVSWYDPPNIFYSSKALVNDIDLIVTSPSGVVYYGNNIKGDELNNNERVVIDTPEVGVYTVRVQGKVFGAGMCPEYFYSWCQKISTVAVSSGEVAFQYESYIDPSTYTDSDERAECELFSSNLFYVALLGSKTTWGESTVTVNSSTYIKTMTPEEIAADYVNPWYPAVDTACLKDDKYTLWYYNNGTSLSGAIDACGAYVTFIQPSFDFVIQGGQCTCSGQWITVEMNAMNTETWYDYYYYEINYQGTMQPGQTRSAWRGSLAIANTQSIRLCLPYGTYSVALKTIDNAAIEDDGIRLKIANCGVSLDMTKTSAECVLTEPPIDDDFSWSNSNPWALDGSWNAAMIVLVFFLVVGAVIGAVVIVRKARQSRRDNDIKARLLN